MLALPRQCCSANIGSWARRSVSAIPCGRPGRFRHHGHVVGLRQVQVQQAYVAGPGGDASSAGRHDGLPIPRPGHAEHLRVSGPRRGPADRRRTAFLVRLWSSVPIASPAVKYTVVVGIPAASAADKSGFRNSTSSSRCATICRIDGAPPVPNARRVRMVALCVQHEAGSAAATPSTPSPVRTVRRLIATRSTSMPLPWSRGVGGRRSPAVREVRTTTAGSQLARQALGSKNQSLLCSLLFHNGCSVLFREPFHPIRVWPAHE